MLAVTASSAELMTRQESGLLGQPSPYPRCLSSMLSNHDRGIFPGASKNLVLSKEKKDKEVELESSSLFVKLEHSDDISPLFSTEESNEVITYAGTQSSSSRPPPPPNIQQLQEKRYRDDGVEGESKMPISSTSNQEDQGSGRDLLADLFPRGFTSTIAPPSAKRSLLLLEEDLLSKSSNANTLAEADKEPELEGTQAWAHLVPSSSPPTVETVKASQQDVQRGQKPQHHNAVPSEELPRSSVPEMGLSSVTPHPMFGKLNFNCDEYETNRERTNIESAVVVVPMEIAAEKGPTACNDDGDVNICNGPDEGETEEEGVSSKEIVIVRGREEEELKRALDRLVPRLLQSEERVKYMERRLQEAMRGESGRNALLKHVAKLESEVKHLQERLELRHCEALEWRDTKQTLEADNARLNAELHRALDRGVRLDYEVRRRHTLLAEAQANADGLVGKKASLEAELRHKDQRLGEAEKERKRAWQTTNSSAETAKAAIRRAEAATMEADSLRNEVRQREHAKSTPEGQPQRSLAADGDWGKKRLSWEPELYRPRSSPLERDRSRERPLSPNRDRSVGRIKRYPIDDGARLDREILDFHDGFVNYSSTTSPPTGDNLARGSVVDVRNGNKLQRMGSRLSSDSDGILEQQLIAPRQEPVWMTEVDDTQPVTVRTKGREQCDIGDRQRYDSEGVKGALTAARPEWADNAPAAVSPKPTIECDDSGLVSNIESSGCQMRAEYAARDQGQDESAQWRDTHSVRRSTEEPLLTELAALGWTPSRQLFPAAGHRRGRDALSSRRSSLTGAGVGVHSESGIGEAGQVPRTETLAPTSKEGGTDSGMLASTHRTTEFDHRNTVGSASWRAPTRLSSCLADMIGKIPPNADGQPESIRRERGPVPFATEAAEDELRPVRELEKNLMLLQMEASQLEAEQSKLLPKASKTMHARVRMRDIESRLERLAKESSRLRRILRNKPWRM